MTATSQLHLLSFAVDQAKLISFAAGRGTIPPSGDLGYVFHQVLNETFGACAPKPFRFGNPFQQAVAYSPHDAAALQDLALQRRNAVPSWDMASQALGLSSMKALALPDDWAEGTRYRFSVRTRPICRISRHGERGLPRECDVFMRAIATKADRSEWLDRQAVYMDWLRGQIPEAAASVVSLALSQLTRTQVYRKGAPRLDGPDVSFSGILQIRDPRAFRDFLARGAGRHRAFGFGMILLGAALAPEAPSPDRLDHNN